MTTERETQGCLELTSISADWDYDTQKPPTWPDNPRLLSIEFHPAAAGDVLVVRQSGSAGALRFYAECDSDLDSRIKYFHGSRCRPYIVYSECVLSAGHKVIIELWREP